MLMVLMSNQIILSLNFEYNLLLMDEACPTTT
jgi:hypothetical protein